MKHPTCDHRDDAAPSWEHSTCTKCGWIITGFAGWEIAANQWFPNERIARFYDKHGRLPDDITPPAS